MSIVPLKRNVGHFRLFRLNGDLANMRNNVATANELNDGANSNLIIVNKCCVKSGSIFNLDPTEVDRLNLNTWF